MLFQPPLASQHAVQPPQHGSGLGDLGFDLLPVAGELAVEAFFGGVEGLLQFLEVAFREFQVPAGGFGVVKSGAVEAARWGRPFAIRGGV